MAETFVLEGEDVPSLEVVGGGRHGKLKGDFGQASGGGVACAVVLGEASDVTFDVGSEGEISFGGRGVEIGDLVLAEQGVVGDEDGAMAGGF